MADPNTVGVGHKVYLGIGEETTYGTAVARSKFIEINSESLKLDIPPIRSNSLYRRGYLNTRRVAGRKVVGGDIEFEVPSLDAEKLFKHLFGSVASSQPASTTVPTAYAHDFTFADVLPTGLTLELFRDSSGFGSDASYANLYEGCRVQSASFSIDAEGVLMCRMSFIGEDESRAAKSTESLNTNANLFSFANASLTVDGLELNAASTEISINNALGPRNHLGTRLTRQPRASGKREVGGRATVEFDDWEQYDAFKNGTVLAVQLESQGDNIGTGVDELFQIILPKCTYTAYPLGTNSVGVYTADVEFQADLQATVGEALMTLINTNTSV